jgi:hypothetical protein
MLLLAILVALILGSGQSAPLHPGSRFTDVAG